MPSPRFEVPAGLVDGANAVFTTSMPYSPGSTAVFINGLLQERSLDDGWYETDPDAGVVTLKEAPQTDGAPDVIQIFFIDRSPQLPEAACVNIRGVVRLGTGRRILSGSLSPAMSMRGNVEVGVELHGRCDARKDLRGSVEVPRQIRATIRECA